MKSGRSWRSLRLGEIFILPGLVAFEERLWLAKTPRRKERVLIAITSINEVAG